MKSDNIQRCGDRAAESTFPVQAKQQWRWVVCTSKTMRHRSRVCNYGHNARLGDKSKKTRARYPRRIMRRLHAQPHRCMMHSCERRRALRVLWGAKWNLPGSGDPVAAYSNSADASTVVLKNKRVHHVIPRVKICSLFGCLCVRTPTGVCRWRCEPGLPKDWPCFPQVDYTSLMRSVSQLLSWLPVPPTIWSYILKPLEMRVLGGRLSEWSALENKRGIICKSMKINELSQVNQSI